MAHLTWSATIDSCKDQPGSQSQRTNTRKKCVLIFTVCKTYMRRFTLQFCHSSLLHSAGYRSVVEKTLACEVSTATHYSALVTESWQSCVGETVGVLPAQPRTCGRQRNRANAPAEDGKEYFKRNITIPMLDQLLMALHSRFGNEQHAVTRAFYLVPSVLQHAADGVASENIREFLNAYRDMPSTDNMDAQGRIQVLRKGGVQYIWCRPTHVACLK